MVGFRSAMVGDCRACAALRLKTTWNCAGNKGRWYYLSIKPSVQVASCERAAEVESTPY